MDPLLAEKIHPNDDRRITNYLTTYADEKMVPSKKVIARNALRRLRYKKPILFWVKDQEKDNL